MTGFIYLFLIAANGCTPVSPARRALRVDMGGVIGSALFTAFITASCFHSIKYTT